MADILVDDSKGAYLDSAMTQPNKDNFTEIYRNSGKIGQCTWYASGRFREVAGDIVTNNNYKRGNTVNDWVRYAASDDCPDLDGITDPYKIQAGSIAVWDGHAAFVEWVDYSSDGMPQTVYITEANAGHNTENRKSGVYYPDYDCKVKKLSMDDFITRGTSEFIGYIVVK